MEKIVTGCPYDCGGSCPLVAHVAGGKIVRLAPEEGLDSPGRPLLIPCARGLAQVQRVNHPDRLLHPLKRVGERGRALFQRVSWDEALDLVAGELRRIKASYGPEAILNLRGAGNTDGLLHHTAALPNRFFNCLGGQTATRGSLSFEGALFACRTTFGLSSPPPSHKSLLQSRLVILWGINPAESIFGTNTGWYMALAKERGTRFISVDPRFTDSAATLADRWIPILPGTDTAMLVAMACVLIQEGLCDQQFLQRYTHGFERFRDYCLGVEDGVLKSPAWAEPICGVPAGTIAGLAREYAASRPADLRGGWAPGRTAYGEQFHRACIALSAMTGNIGMPGGGPGCWVSQDFQGSLAVSRLPGFGNPTGKSVLSWRWADAVLKGTAGGYPSDIRMIYSIGGNRLNQCGDIKKGIEALKKVEFVVVQDQFMTPTARYADMILPASTHFEREDVQVPHNQGDYLIYNGKAIEPQGEARSDLEILTALAERLGVSGFNDRTEREWLRGLTRRAPVEFEVLRGQGVYRYGDSLSPSALERFVAAPEDNPLPTPSGKIEIWSHELSALGDPRIPPIPCYMQDRQSPERPAAARYPLLLVTTHSRKRVLSTFDNVPWLRELEPHTIWISSKDAADRGIRDGQRVAVHNSVGTLAILARVTERIRPGVVAINQGAWYQPDERGRDLGGSVNVLCKDLASPGEASAMNGVLVEVSPWKD